ncbi:hypothetical protein [Natronobiforma cellulositropha]|uniref:hypothetical protein n=1 Tax=Natronobiforma cellulositropha TaxID=1679076 RepID=UPI0021D57B5E|nr:hypothetical protein [Natronobiforma cellulositropha]
MIDVTPLVTKLGILEFVVGLEPLERSMFFGVTTIVLGVVVLGLLTEYATTVVKTTQRSPVISFLVGVPTALVLVSLVYVGQLLAASRLGIFFAIPLIAAAAIPLVVWTAMGFVSLGGFFARRLGLEGLWIWVPVGGALCSLFALYLPVGLAIASVAAIFGSGAGARTTFNGGLSAPDERVVPPANKT